MYIWPAFTSAAPAWNANHSSPRRRSASTISVVLPTPGSPTSSTERGREAARAAVTASTAAAREPTSVARGRSSVSTIRPSVRKKSTSIVSVCHCSSAGVSAARVSVVPFRRSAPARAAAGAAKSFVEILGGRRDARRSSPALPARSRSPARAGCRSSPPPPPRARPGGLSRRRRRGREAGAGARPTRRARTGSPCPRSTPAAARAPRQSRHRRRRAEELRRLRSAASAKPSSSISLRDRRAVRRAAFERRRRPRARRRPPSAVSRPAASPASASTSPSLFGEWHLPPLVLDTRWCRDCPPSGSGGAAVGLLL